MSYRWNCCYLDRRWVEGVDHRNRNADETRSPCPCPCPCSCCHRRRVPLSAIDVIVPRTTPFLMDASLQRCLRITNHYQTQKILELPPLQRYIMGVALFFHLYFFIFIYLYKLFICFFINNFKWKLMCKLRIENTRVTKKIYIVCKYWYPRSQWYLLNKWNLLL